MAGVRLGIDESFRGEFFVVLKLAKEMSVNAGRLCRESKV